MVMRRGLILAGLLASLIAPSVISAQLTLDVGQRIELKAFSNLGVPLHREARSSLVGRAPDGSKAEILEFNINRHWLRIQLETNDQTAWIVSRYVRRIIEGEPTPENGEAPGVTEDERQVWTSAEACEQVVNAGRRMAPQQPDRLRFVTWNIRWFPDGSSEQPGPGDEVQPADLKSLALDLPGSTPMFTLCKKFVRRRPLVKPGNPLQTVSTALPGTSGCVTCKHAALGHGNTWAFYGTSPG